MAPREAAQPEAISLRLAGPPAFGGSASSNVVEITRQRNDTVSEYRFRVGRGAKQGAFGVRVEAVLGVMGGCNDYRPEHMELRVDLQD